MLATVRSAKTGTASNAKPAHRPARQTRAALSRTVQRAMNQDQGSRWSGPRSWVNTGA